MVVLTNFVCSHRTARVSRGKKGGLHSPKHFGHHHHHKVERADVIPNWNVHDLFHEIQYNLVKREKQPLHVRSKNLNNFWGDGYVPF